MEYSKQNIGKLFNSIAANYDFINHLTSLNIDKLWRKKAIKSMSGQHERLLDVAIGTADLAIEIIRQDKAKIVEGIDLSEGMMRIGAEKAMRKGYGDRISFTEGSCLELPYDDNSFPAITCSYGIRNFSNLDKGLQEMHRVMKEGGELLILEFSYPDNPVIRFFYNLYFKYILSFIGRIISKDKTAFNYFYKSVVNFTYGDAMVKRLEAAGFRNVTYTTMTFGISTYYKATK